MMPIYFCLGALSGFFSSTPLGPINLWVTDHKFSASPKINLLFFLAAVILVDIIFAGIALWGQFDLLADSREIRWAGIISGLFTIMVGFYIWKSSNLDVKIDESRPKLDSLKSFVQGLALTGANPAFILFWLFIANQMVLHIDTTISHYDLGLFLLGVIIGDILWFVLFGMILSYLEERSQAKTLKYIRKVVSLIFIMLGFIAIGSYAIE